MLEEQKHIDQFTRKIIQDADLEQPSLDFTAAIMAKVEKNAQSAPIRYEPLISRKAWFFIGLVIVAVVLLVTIGGKAAPNEILSKIAMPQFQLDISPIFTYSFFSLALFFLLGIPFLRDNTNQPTITQ